MMALIVTAIVLLVALALYYGFGWALMRLGLVPASAAPLREWWSVSHRADE